MLNDYSSSVLVKTSDLPIRHVGQVHDGKVRSVYWLSPEDSYNLIKQEGYDAYLDTQLGVQIISDRISAYDVNWGFTGGIGGVVGKGASLNAISEHWFDDFDAAGITGNHILERPHPMVWIVQKADPALSVEGIGRQYITGGMWRDYDAGSRNFCGIDIQDGLAKNQELENLLITPTTKGIVYGIPGVPEEEDTNISRQQIIDNYKAFGFKKVDDVELYEILLTDGFKIISDKLRSIGEILVDTKFEFGYVRDLNGNYKLIYIDEVGTPDSSRYWNLNEYLRGNVVENSKEIFRSNLLDNFDNDIFLDKTRMAEREQFAKNKELPIAWMEELSETYMVLAKKITGKKVEISDDPKTEIVEALDSLGLIKH
ncbi:MAG: phosphoribosylaminoimidazolesuccinocarboxamide synthase [Nanohaloarchaea archaeon]|nr:phosphoribosylaminoimidazolesuccinocarboxamide synthase [Candidatus Nanohaloarchaea archaeon]